MLILSLILTLITGWVILVLYVNDFSLSNLNLKRFLEKSKFKSIVIYPHPDDETMASGGLIQKLKNSGEVKVISVTKGQYGTELLNLPPNELANVRSKEFMNAMNKFGIKNYELWEFIDGTLIESHSQLVEKIEETIKSFNPDLIVTYERSGVYGHPDHIALSKAVKAVADKNKTIKVLYSTLPARLLKKFELPTHLNGIPIPEFQKQMVPEFKIFTLPYNFAKLRAAKGYKSQNLSHGIPLEVINAVGIFEYYTTKYLD